MANARQKEFLKYILVGLTNYYKGQVEEHECNLLKPVEEIGRLKMELVDEWYSSPLRESA